MTELYICLYRQQTANKPPKHTRPHHLALSNIYIRAAQPSVDNKWPELYSRSDYMSRPSLLVSFVIFWGHFSTPVLPEEHTHTHIPHTGFARTWKWEIEWALSWKTHILIITARHSTRAAQSANDTSFESKQGRECVRVRRFGGGGARRPRDTRLGSSWRLRVCPPAVIV